MYYVYVISSKSRSYNYVGLTSNVDRRLNEHNSGKNKTTKPYGPFELIFIKEFATRQEARVYEKYLKSGSGREFIKKGFSS